MVTSHAGVQEVLACHLYIYIWVGGRIQYRHDFTPFCTFLTRVIVEMLTASVR